MAINPMIPLMAKTPNIQPALNQLIQGVRRGPALQERATNVQANKLAQAQGGQQEQIARIGTAANIGQQLIPALDAGDTDRARQVLQRAQEFDPKMAQDGLQMLEQNPQQLRQLAQRAIEVNKRIQPQRPNKFARTLGATEITDPGPDKKFNTEDDFLRKVVPQATGPGEIQLIDLGRSPKPTLQQEADLAGAKQAAKLRESRVGEIIQSGLQGAKGIPALRRSIKLLDDVDTGGFQNVALRTKQIFGVEGANEGELSSNLGQAILGDLRETFGAQFTEREGERLERIRANFGKSPETNKRLLKQSLQIAEASAERAQEAAIKRKDFDTAKTIQEMLDFEFEFDDREGQGEQKNVQQPDGFKVLRIRDQ